MSSAHAEADAPPVPDSLDPLAARAAALAASWVVARRRLDMQRLSAALGVSRVTLFRHAGGREALLAAALRQLTEQALALAERRHERAPEGRSRAVGVLRIFNDLVSTSAGLRRLLDEEPALTIRVLTDPRGVIQPAVIARVESLLRRDEEEGGFDLIIEPGALAVALVRLGEAFLYADVLASRPVDVDTANRLQEALIVGTR